MKEKIKENVMEKGLFKEEQIGKVENGKSESAMDGNQVGFENEKIKNKILDERKIDIENERIKEEGHGDEKEIQKRDERINVDDKKTSRDIPSAFPNMKIIQQYPCFDEPMKFSIKNIKNQLPSMNVINEDKEYYMNLHVGGKFVRDPYVRYEGDTPDIIDDILLTNAGEGNDKGDCIIEMVAEGEGGIKVDTDGVDGVDAAVGECDDDDVVARKDVVVVSEHEESDSEDDNAYYINVSYLSDGQDDGELQSTREKMKSKEQVEVDTDSENETATENEIHQEAVDGGENIEVTGGVGGTDTDYYDSDYHWSLIRDHPKMKSKEIQRRAQYDIHVNVKLSKCRRAKNLVTSRLDGNCKE
ncbi:hypothetical protein F3Y22_tig00113725pilonHSYRG01074 [Hibiscus syriacus]|uniref:Uncharacterized protein n=1 Tax=Hibiscus syriacus TaxID=106335 RepID=A0A6A2Y1G5_HIBSY|nr:hypothetical protein F3Y22_tig00113725pilonHSYRG01074 [Hibiscus syriacus]